MAETKKQYLLKVQFANRESSESWWNGARLDPMAKKGQQFYESAEDAKNALNRLLRNFNRDFVYDENGRRVETHSVGGGFTADMVVTKDMDDMNRIDHWTIQVRDVTPWTTIESA